MNYIDNNSLNNSLPGSGRDVTIDFKRYFLLLLSNWYWFAIALFLSTAIAYGINRYSEKIFSVSATILINDEQLGGGITGSGAFIPGGDMFTNQQNLKNEIGILKSFTLNKRVIDSLPDFHISYMAVGRRNIIENRKYKSTPFVVVPDSNTIQPTDRVYISILSEDSCKIEINGDNNFERKLKFGDHFNELGFNFKIDKNTSPRFIYDNDESNKYYFLFPDLNRLANQYRYKLKVTPVDLDASLVNLSILGPVPEQDQDYLNMLMELYLKQGLEYKNETAEKSLEFINDQLKIIQDSLKVAEDMLEAFRQENRLVEISREGVLAQTKLEKIEDEKILHELQRDYYDYLRDYLNSKQEPEDIISPSVLGVTDQQIINLVQELNKVQVEKNQLSLNLSDNTLPVKQMEERLEGIRSALRDNVEGAIMNLDNIISDERESILMVEAQIARLPGTEKQMINFQRKFDINNTVYTYLLEKRAEVGISKASNVADNRIIDRATLYSSSLQKPKRRRNFIMAIVFGFFIPFMAIYILDHLNNKIIDRVDIEKKTNIPILGYISHNEFESEFPVSEKPGSTLAESFRLVRTNLKYYTADISNPVIAISSAISSEGKTFISLNLATITALLGKKVLLVGLDLRKPRIHKVLDLDNKKGISSYLAGDALYNDIIRETEVPNLFFAASGPVPPNPAELIESERMKEFIEESKKAYDYIFIDTPPTAIVADAVILAPLVDLYLLVVRQGYSSVNTLELIQDLYLKGTLGTLGLVLNDISKTGYYGYGLRYGYAYRNNYYGKYYYTDSMKGYYTDD